MNFYPNRPRMRIIVTIASVYVLNNILDIWIHYFNKLFNFTSQNMFLSKQLLCTYIYPHAYPLLTLRLVVCIVWQIFIIPCDKAAYLISYSHSQLSGFKWHSSSASQISTVACKIVCCDVPGWYDKFIGCRTSHICRAKKHLLTHLPLVTHIYVNELGHHCFYLNQCWLIVNSAHGNKFQWNWNRNSLIFIQENAFENVVWQLGGHLVQGGGMS